MDSTARIFAIATGGASGGCRTAGGFAMLEVLITLLILLLGLLGLLGLMTRANTAELESYQRVQAVIIASKIDPEQWQQAAESEH